MLLSFASLTNFLGMVVALWLAAYLLARGFASRITLRAVLVLAILAAYFLNTYLNFYESSPGVRAWQVLLIVAGLAAWHDLNYNLLPPAAQRRIRWAAAGVYALDAVTFIVLAAVRPFANWDFTLSVQSLRTGPWPFVGLYAAAILVTTAAALYHFRRVGRREPHSRGTWAASLLAAAAIGCGSLALVLNAPALWLSQSALLLAGVGLLGSAVARRQSFVERMTTLREFPISGLAIVGLSGLYALLGRGQGFTPKQLALVTVLAVLTHSSYDLVREFLDRLLHRRENSLRTQLRALAREVASENGLEPALQEGLTALCRTLNASGGFIAMPAEPGFTVSVTANSLPVGTALAPSDVRLEDVYAPPAALVDRVAWLAPALVGGQAAAVVGLGSRWSRGTFSESDLDLLGETADWVGRLVLAYQQRQATQARLTTLTEAAQTETLRLQVEATGFMAAMENNPSPEFVRCVEDGLRNLADYIALGQSRLAVELGVQGATHTERGKAVRHHLQQAIDRLRPAGARPGQPLPREWHSYAVLHDAYIEDVPNREIMARLYISEGTFNRTRRKALRAVARDLLELRGPGPR